jgi:hypothetical protein
MMVMSAEKKQVFVSYHTEDLDFVQELSVQLKDKLPDVEVIYDRVLPTGSSFAETLASGINTSQIILAVLSPGYLTSSWATQELKIAIERSLNSDTKLIPLILRPCNLRGYVSMLKPVDFTKNQDQALTELIWGITGQRPSAATGQDPGRPTRDIDIAELPGVREELEEVQDNNRRFRSRGLEKSSEESPRPGGVQRCFVLMPFNHTDLQYVYETIVAPAASKYGICERGDDAFGSNVIMEDVLSKIKLCTFAIADLTGQNANVFYELGICHALRKPVLLLSQKVEDLPFDLRHRRVIFYEYSPPGIDKLRAQMEQNLHAMLREAG